MNFYDLLKWYGWWEEGVIVGDIFKFIVLWYEWMLRGYCRGNCFVENYCFCFESSVEYFSL